MIDAMTEGDVVASPCKAFGHTAGRDTSGHCRECRRLYDAIRRGMIYHFYKRIEWPGRRVVQRLYDRRRYERCRRKGMSSYAAKRETPEKHYARVKAWRLRWGGDACPSGNPSAFVNRLIAQDHELARPAKELTTT